MPNSLRPHGLQPTRLLYPWDFPGKDTGVGCHFLLQGIFPTQGSNPGLLHCRQILYWLSYKGSPCSPYFIIQILFYSQGMVDGLCQWLFCHSPASLNLKGPTLPLMTVSFVTCGDNLDEEKETNFSSMPEDPKGKILMNQFCLFF